MSMKKSSDTIGNQTRDLQVYSTVPQPLHYLVPKKSIIIINANSRMQAPEFPIITGTSVTVKSSSGTTETSTGTGVEDSVPDIHYNEEVTALGQYITYLLRQASGLPDLMTVQRGYT
jgi:hypothetical protein